MKRMLSAIALLAAIAAGYSSGAAAQETPESRSPQEQRPQAPGEDALLSESRGSGLAPLPYTMTMSMRIEQVPRPVDAASQLIGMVAVSSRGEKVGEILAVIRSPTNELLAIVDAGEFFGVGVRPVALPVEPGRIDRNGNLTVQASREELERLPVFATNLIQ